MRGAVAAGHPHTAHAGAKILEEGGNAVDACVAAAFVAWVAESPLTGPGAGGFMLVHRARDRTTRVLDFFVAVPGRGLPAGGVEMEAVDVRFDEKTVQTFLIGAASCAVPGDVAGLAEAHRLYGQLGWADVLAPAVKLARAGIALNRSQAVVHAVLDPVLRRDAEGRRIYGRGASLPAGGRLVMNDLADTLEWLADGGPEVFYRGELARRIVACIRDRGGRLTEEDLRAYRVVRRRPVAVRFRGDEFLTNPPPSSGGVLTAFALRVLDGLPPLGGPGLQGTIVTLAEVMREAARVRADGLSANLHRGGMAGRLLAEEAVRDATSRVQNTSLEPVLEPHGLPSTTHISVVDGDGNAASMSSSTGCGSGVVIPGTGVHMNNMLGEIDLNPGGRLSTPGKRLTSMMTPSLILEGGRPRLVVGSAGSERLRGAILQIVINVVDHGMNLEEAIRAPRIHLDDGVLHLEGGNSAAVAGQLRGMGYEVVRWRGRNLFFGGVSAVSMHGADLAAAGDPRRGGAGVVVG